MPRKLFYVPLENIPGRYTSQWSAEKTGWMERNFIKHNIPYQRIDPGFEPRPIKTGCVLDAIGRSDYCFRQMKMLLEEADKGNLTTVDCIWFDDFWSPGIESLPYFFDQANLKPKMYAFLHAQSVDEFDFTHKMRSWMRHFEKGIAEFLTGICVCGNTLKDLVVFGSIAPKEKVHATGHPTDWHEIMERMPKAYQHYIGFEETPEMAAWYPPRQNKVVYSSRFDSEKNPHFFLNVVEKLIQENIEGRELQFVICTGGKHLRSNDPTAVHRAKAMVEHFPNNFFIKENLTKEEYYAELCTAKIQFNCASQDFDPITLQEASVAGCYPIYPYFRSFPEVLRHEWGYFYPMLELAGACGNIRWILSKDDLWTNEKLNERAWIHTRLEYSVERMLNVMGFLDTNPESLYKE